MPKQSKAIWWALGLGAAGAAAFFLFRKSASAGGTKQLPGPGPGPGPGPDPGLDARREKLMPAFRSAASRHGVPLPWLLAIAHRESAFKNVRSKSGASDDRRGGAWGVMQMTSATAADMGFMPTAEHEDRGKTILANVGTGIDLGARYLARLIKRFGRDLEKVAAGYNAGPGAVQRGTIPASTRDRYVPGVVSLANRYESAS